MKICPLCQKQHPDHEKICSEDGTELILKKTTLPWDMEGLAGEEDENEDDAFRNTSSNTFLEFQSEDTYDFSQDADASHNAKTQFDDDDQTVGTSEQQASDLDHAERTSDEQEPVIAPGSILGSYQLESKLGEGGMGEVYLAEHMKLGRKVAIKVLRQEFAHNQNAVDRFFNEARAVNQIAHRNIVQITDFFEQAGGQNYYVMEYLEGSSLQDLLVTQGAMSAEDIIHIGVQIASALEAVHGKNIIHRDLKPENIIILNSDDFDNYVKLLDFGVAKLLEPVQGMPLNQTQTGVIMGTPEYMAPEQLKREPVTPLTDMYAFGLILFEMATGCRPWKYDNMGELVVAHMTKIPPMVNSVSSVKSPLPLAIEQLIADCLAKEVDQRPKNMKEAADRLLSAAGENQEIVRRSPQPALSGSQRLSPVPTQPPQTMVTGGFDANAIEEAMHRGQRRTALSIAVVFGLLITGVAGVALQWDKLLLSPEEEQAKNQPRTEEGPQTIEVFLESSPSGASVYDEKEDALLGKTPLRLPLVTEQAKTKRVFFFVLDGYHKLKKESIISDQAKISVALIKKETAPKASSAKKPRRADKAKTKKPSLKRSAQPRTAPKSPKKAPKPQDLQPKAKSKPKSPPKTQDKSGLIDPFSM